MPVSTAETLKRRRKVLPKGKDYQITLRPHIETINDDAYFVMAKVMEQLATRMRDGDKLNQNDVNMYYKFADMLVKMQREERMGLQDKADEFDRMTPEELADMIRKAGSDDEET